MDVDPVALAAELRSLRRGRAARHPSVPARLGPQVRRLCGITDGDDGGSARTKMVTVLGSIMAEEPSHLRLAVLAALALHRAADHRDLAARQRWLAGELHCHERTARRRVDEAFAVLVQRVTAVHDTLPGAARVEPWQVQSIRAFLRLDGPTPEITEHRTLLITGGEVGEIVCRFTLPQRRAEAEHDLAAEILYGGQIVRRDRPSRDHFRYVVQLPRVFAEGETHEYTIRLTLPAGMAPHYVLQPLVEVRAFDVKVRFTPGAVPREIWRLDGVAPRMIDAEHDERERLSADRFGELQLRFQHLRQGYAYGLTWGRRGAPGEVTPHPSRHD